jgi:hypothetical protein
MNHNLFVTLLSWWFKIQFYTCFDIYFFKSDLYFSLCYCEKYLPAFILVKGETLHACSLSSQDTKVDSRWHNWTGWRSALVCCNRQCLSWESNRASPLPPSGFSSYSSSLKAVPAYQWWPCYAPRMVARIEFVSRGPDAIEASAAWVLKPRD